MRSYRSSAHGVDVPSQTQNGMLGFLCTGPVPTQVGQALHLQQSIEDSELRMLQLGGGVYSQNRPWTNLKRIYAT
jgi:hypothetical protein